MSTMHETSFVNSFREEMAIFLHVKRFKKGAISTIISAFILEDNSIVVKVQFPQILSYVTQFHVLISFESKY